MAELIIPQWIARMNAEAQNRQALPDEMGRLVPPPELPQRQPEWRQGFDSPMPYGDTESTASLLHRSIGEVGNRLTSGVTEPIRKTMGPLYGEMGGTSEDVLNATMMGMGAGWPGRGKGPNTLGVLRSEGKGGTLELVTKKGEGPAASPKAEGGAIDLIRDFKYGQKGTAKRTLADVLFTDKSAIKNIIDADPKYHYGLRVTPPKHQEISVQPGDKLNPSFPWTEDGIIEGAERLGGVSTVGVTEKSSEGISRALNRIFDYVGPKVDYVRVVLVRGTKRKKGTDTGEWIISNPEVVKVWDSDSPNPTRPPESGRLIPPPELPRGTVKASTEKSLSNADIVPSDAMSVLNKSFYYKTGTEIPEKYWEGMTLGKLGKFFDTLGLREEIFTEATNDLNKMGYSKIGDVIDARVTTLPELRRGK